jgi:hypothetical protein
MSPFTLRLPVVHLGGGRAYPATAKVCIGHPDSRALRTDAIGGAGNVAHPRFQLIPGIRLVGGAGGGVGWRLLGSNNRELGRSSLAYPDAEAALEAVSVVRRLAASGEAHIVHDRVTGLWIWQLKDAGELVANSGRGFRHERECRYNLEQFRSSAPSAPASDHDIPLDLPWQRTSHLVPAPEAAS